MSDAPALELAGVSHSFLSVRALKEIDLTLQRGEIIGLVGPNGAGKTTTLNIAATLVQPTHGRVRVMNHDALHERASIRRLLGYMPEEYGVYDDMAVGEYLSFFADAYGLPGEGRARRIAEFIAEAGLEPRRVVGELSKGLKQRLFFSKTLLHEPAVVLLDEPFSGMDPAAVAWTVSRISRESGKGRAFLIASHDLAELERVATRLVGIRHGRIAPTTSSSGSTIFRIRVAGDRAPAEAILSARFPEWRVVEDERDGFEVRLPGQLPAHEVLRAIVEAGVPVSAFEKQEIAVDELYASTPEGTS